MEGTFLFKRFDQFHDQPPPIGDWFEGRTSIDIPDYAYRTSHGPTPLGPGWVFGPGATGSSIKNITILYEADLCWISCFSVGVANDMSSQMLFKEPSNYDAAANLMDIERIARLIWGKGRLPSKRPVRSAFTDLQFGRVIYSTSVSQTVTPIGAAYTPPNPFQKARFFEFQKEYRLVLQPKKTKFDKLPSTMLVTCPLTKKLINPVIRSGEFIAE
ncbi:hypothetical protein KUV49_11815 [Roseovarius atlanticus]|nr:hypothetical protein [Roseovarius atlanticus]